MTMGTKSRVPLVCSYDSEADAAYIYLDHPIAPAAAQRMIPFEATGSVFNLDLNANGHVLGLQILGAGTHLPPALLAAILDADPIDEDNQ
jgi:uncharacterized protein YuzE